jgi:hypothetical protein
MNGGRDQNRSNSGKSSRLDLAPPLADGSSWGWSPSIAARHFSSCPLDSTLRWTPCPPEYDKQRLQVRLGYIQLSVSRPFRSLHTFCFLRPARLLPPAFGYGAPHLSARGTLTLSRTTRCSAHTCGLPTTHQQRLRRKIMSVIAIFRQ